MRSIREIIQERIKIAYTHDMAHGESHSYPHLSGAEEAISEIESNLISEEGIGEIILEKLIAWLGEGDYGLEEAECDIRNAKIRGVLGCIFIIDYNNRYTDVVSIVGDKVMHLNPITD